jgi:hypothetical protein
MHHEAMEWVHSALRPVSVLELGSYNVNGTIRDLFSGVEDYLGVDLRPGPGVDWVGNAATLRLGRTFEIVVSCEVLEHAAEWREIIATAARHTWHTGRFIGTAAGPGREPHTNDGSPWDGREHYENIDPDELRSELEKHFGVVDVNVLGSDVRWVARFPKRREDAE